MSTCISKHGEYSEHGPLTDGYWCEWCGALDEAAMRKGIESAVREQVAQAISATVITRDDQRRILNSGYGTEWVNGYVRGVTDAARIARGEQ